MNMYIDGYMKCMHIYLGNVCKYTYISMEACFTYTCFSFFWCLGVVNTQSLKYCNTCGIARFHKDIYFAIFFCDNSYAYLFTYKLRRIIFELQNLHYTKNKLL